MFTVCFQAKKSNTNLWDSIVRAMPAEARQQMGSRSMLPLEIAPQLKYILRPAIKMQNMHLMSTLEKARLEAHAGIMALLGLSYNTSHDAGSKDLTLEPAIDKLVTFQSGAADEASPISQELMKSLQFQVTDHTILYLTVTAICVSEIVPVPGHSAASLLQPLCRPT